VSSFHILGVISEQVRVLSVNQDDYLNPDGRTAHSLVRFDTSVFPADMVIDRAILRVYLDASYDYAGGAHNIRLYRIDSPWTESGVSWNTEPSLAGTPITSTVVPHGGFAWYWFDVTELVQQWVDGSVPNYGIALRGYEPTWEDAGWRSFSTREGLYAPQLIVNHLYAPIAPMDPIAFHYDRDIYLVNPDGTGLVRLTNHPYLVSNFQPDWSPDHTKIAFVSNRDGNDEIYVMNADGSGQTRLTYTPASRERSPAWSPDGTRIAFDTDRHENDEIYVMNADGSGQTRLTYNSVNDNNPTWSPSGTQLAFQSYRSGNWEIYVMNADGSGQTNLTKHSANEQNPAWSPSGTQIAFSSNRNGTDDIYTVNPGGGGLTRVTYYNLANEYNVDWSPDGQRMVFLYQASFSWIGLYVMNADGTEAAYVIDYGMTPSW
jgi:hypothetical protein